MNQVLQINQQVLQIQFNKYQDFKINKYCSYRQITSFYQNQKTYMQSKSQKSKISTRIKLIPSLDASQIDFYQQQVKQKFIYENLSHPDIILNCQNCKEQVNLVGTDNHYYKNTCIYASRAFKINQKAQNVLFCLNNGSSHQNLIFIERSSQILKQSSNKAQDQRIKSIVLKLCMQNQTKKQDILLHNYGQNILLIQLQQKLLHQKQIKNNIPQQKKPIIDYLKEALKLSIKRYQKIFFCEQKIQQMIKLQKQRQKINNLRQIGRKRCLIERKKKKVLKEKKKRYIYRLRQSVLSLHSSYVKLKKTYYRKYVELYHRRQLKNDKALFHKYLQQKKVFRQNYEVQKNIDICPICQDVLQNSKQQNKKNKVTYLGCSHKYHDQCLQEWLQVNEMCLLCKARVINTKKYIIQ